VACSGVPDFKLTPCCERHDRAYRRGGSEGQRRRADKRFRACMKSQGSKYVRYAYYSGVRCFGWAFFCYAGRPSLATRCYGVGSRVLKAFKPNKK